MTFIASILSGVELSISHEPAGVGHAAEGELATYPLDPVELAFAKEMPEPRHTEFLLGRLAAARAIAQLGFSPRPVTRRGRIPDFGEGLHGSISHSHGYALALAVPTAEVLGVGVDLELGRLSPRAARRITGPQERGWIAQASDNIEAGARATLLFAIKESVFKALAPSLEHPPQLHSIQVECTRLRGPIRAHVPLPSGRISRSISLDVSWWTSSAAIVSWTVYHSA